MQTIALVDDDRNILTSVSIALETEGYCIMTYTDGVSALVGFKANPPDLAILDIKMPRIGQAPRPASAARSWREQIQEALTRWHHSVPPDLIPNSVLFERFSLTAFRAAFYIPKVRLSHMGRI